MKEIEYELQELILTTDLSEIDFQDFGKNTIKKFGVSPDAFYQAAAHIATKRTLYAIPSSPFGWILFVGTVWCLPMSPRLSRTSSTVALRPSAV